MGGRLVCAQDLSRAYGRGGTRRDVLSGVTLDVDAGELVAVVGPSGSGKSTLLHLVGGLDRPSRGRVVIAGTDLGALSGSQLAAFRLRHVGFVFQAFHLIPELSALENVLLPARLARDVDAGRRRALGLFDALGLRDATRRRPADLSGGEQQRVAIARALVMEPTLVLADEPTGNLDATSGATVTNLLRGLVGAARSVIVVTHDERQTDAASRVLRLLDGRIE